MIITTFRDKEVQVKERLSLAEATGFADYVVQNVTDIYDCTYSPLFYDVALIQAFFLYYIKDIEVPTIQEVDDNLDEYNQFIGSIKASEGFNMIEFRKNINNIDNMIGLNKQIIVQKQTNDKINELTELTKEIAKQNESISDMMQEFIKEKLEVIKLEKKAINETLEMNKRFSKKDIDKYLKIVDNLNKNMKNPAYQKAFVDEIVNLKESEESADVVE